MNDLTKYGHKEEWSRRGKNFTMQIVRWETMSEESFNKMNLDIGTYTGRYVWNVYFYLFPKHRLFAETIEDDMNDCPVNNLHYGCTFSRWHYNEDGEITAKQYGCDYNHYTDERFSFIKNIEDAYEIFNDAEDLFNELEGEK